MQACTTLMAIPLLMSMTMLVVVRIPLAAALLPPPWRNFKPSNFISSCFCFAMDFATLGIFLHVHPFLHYRFFECASHSFRGFLSLSSQWQVNGMTILNMQVLMLGNFSPLYVTCSKKPPPPPSLYTKSLLLVTNRVSNVLLLDTYMHWLHVLDIERL